MNNSASLIPDLRAHLALCEELWRITERENRVLHSPDTDSLSEFHQRRQRVLPSLDASVLRLKTHRQERQRDRPPSRAPNPEVDSLVRQVQDLIMKILVLDRENEQARLRRGLLPAQRVPSVGSQRPHFVAELYRRHSQV